MAITGKMYFDYSEHGFGISASLELLWNTCANFLSSNVINLMQQFTLKFSLIHTMAYKSVSCVAGFQEMHAIVKIIRLQHFQPCPHHSLVHSF